MGCSTCDNPRLADIHRALDDGQGVNATARAFGIPPATLKLHLRHRPAPGPGPAPPPELEDADEPVVDGELALDDIDGRIHQLARTADQLRLAAEDENEPQNERRATLGECRRTIQTMTVLAEKRAAARQVAILAAPEWVALRAVILEALGPHPEARADLLEALRGRGA